MADTVSVHTVHNPYLSLDGLVDVPQADVPGGFPQGVSAVGPYHGLDDTLFDQPSHNLGEIIEGDVLVLGNLLHAVFDYGLVPYIRQRPYCIVESFRYLHRYITLWILCIQNMHITIW